MSDVPDRTERLWPAASTWLVVAVMAGFCAAVALPFGPGLALVTLVATVAVVAVVLVATAPVVGVRGGQVVAGRARVPVGLIAAVTVLDTTQLRQAAGPGLDARAYLCLRGWVHTGLRLDLADPQDPTPYWLVSCRRPEQLRQAVEEARRLK